MECCSFAQSDGGLLQNKRFGIHFLMIPVRLLPLKWCLEMLFGPPSTRAGGQDDMSFNKLPQLSRPLGVIRRVGLNLTPCSLCRGGFPESLVGFCPPPFERVSSPSKGPRCSRMYLREPRSPTNSPSCHHIASRSVQETVLMPTRTTPTHKNLKKHTTVL